MPFRFVHTADLHLDSPLKSLALRNPDLADLVRGATREALTRIVDLCVAERVDALVVAGDLYDGAQTSMSTALFLVSELRRLTEAGIAVFLIRGNHDAISKVTRELTLPDGVHLLAGRKRSHVAGRLADGREVVIHGVSFAEAEAPQSLLPSFAPPQADAVNIGLLHTSLAGSPGHDAYAPCAVADLVAHGFDYWALGHIHKRTVWHETPHIVMPGMPQGRDINEAGERSVTLVTIDEKQGLSIEERATAGAIFERLAVDVGGADEWRDLLGRVDAALRSLRDSRRAAHLILRVTLTGPTPLAWRLRRDRDLLLAEIESIAQSRGANWIESVDIDCTDAQAADGTDPVAELAAILDRDVLGTHAAEAEALAAIEDLMRALPHEVRAALADSEEAVKALAATSLAEGGADVLAHLRATSGDGSPATRTGGA
ncbi:DNA repair exonuclease SbcCD nuclease subunit [Rhizobium sp. RU20A]|uniref:metallophosphoesterase family protein n=1 Tax=Rhizobium sp. RU20A TaxID=1907412 RepID=UPI000953B41C|nr:DNA repair exonuclease [Rhizobium sp. RU20A]SIP96483.1 DNA repair exonuclease SbcCD nuclease subunit [Rhizobium sp. RU20A]